VYIPETGLILGGETVIFTPLLEEGGDHYIKDSSWRRTPKTTTIMSNPYYNTGSNHTDYTQGSHALPQSPFQQAHPNTTGTATQQHLPVYQQSPYTVHPLPPHGYATAASDHGVLQYTTTVHHPHTARWVNSIDPDENMLTKYRQEDPEPDYEMDQDHQQQQHMQSMQAPTGQQESQSHASLQHHPPITSLSAQPESMSPATRPGGIRTGIILFKVC